jgi:peptidoglycan/xylan/chitin deacetylase (PgdA/CDA1 family)
MNPQPKFNWPKDHKCAAVLSFDVDAESAILAMDLKYAQRASTMSHQAYGPKVGVPRLLGELDRAGVKGTFFIPGFTAKRYPDLVRRIVAEGHEVAWHNDLHESLFTLDENEERAILERGAEVLEPLTGYRPTGYRAPWWELNPRTPALLAEIGFEYDSSMMDDDAPYILETSAGPLVELPVHWLLDDWEQYGFLGDPNIGAVIETPRKAFELWSLEFEAMHEEGCLFMLTMHPFLSGRPSRAKNIGRIVEFASDLGHVWFATAGEVAAHVKGVVQENEYRRLTVPFEDQAVVNEGAR